MPRQDSDASSLDFNAPYLSFNALKPLTSDPLFPTLSTEAIITTSSNMHSVLLILFSDM